MSSPADIAIYGGAAGGGKTWAMLLEPLRHINNPLFGAVVFRRTIQEVIKEGGMWDEASNIYPFLGAKPNGNEHKYEWPGGGRVTFSHLQYDTTIRDWRGAQIPLMEFDQLETFTPKQFFYLLSRNRSMCGVKPYVRATCNPEPGWLADFLGWWIADDGYANLERSGKIRWMIKIQDRIYWADTREQLISLYPDSLPKSVTFIVSTIYDNQKLLEADPDYLSNLEALDYIDRQRLLGDPQRGGNWKIKPSAGNIFNREWFEVVDAVPDGGRLVRFWDFAGTAKKTIKDDPDFTASVKMKRVGNTYYILDSTADQIAPSKADNYLKGKAIADGHGVAIRWELEPGGSSRRYAHNLVTFLAGYDARPVLPQGDKLMRAKGLAAQSEAGNVKLLRGPWNEAWLSHMHGQPDLPHDDTMDASSGAFNELVKPATGGRSW